jgi:hypothetical protein
MHRMGTAACVPAPPPAPCPRTAARRCPQVLRFPLPQTQKGGTLLCAAGLGRALALVPKPSAFTHAQLGPRLLRALADKAAHRSVLITTPSRWGRPGAALASDSFTQSTAPGSQLSQSQSVLPVAPQPLLARTEASPPPLPPFHPSANGSTAMQRANPTAVSPHSPSPPWHSSSHPSSLRHGSPPYPDPDPSPRSLGRHRPCPLSRPPLPPPPRPPPPPAPPPSPPWPPPGAAAASRRPCGSGACGRSWPTVRIQRRHRATAAAAAAAAVAAARATGAGG